MNVPGSSNSTRSDPIGPSQATPWKRRRHGPMLWRLAIACGHEADIVAVADMARTRIAEPDEEQHGKVLSCRGNSAACPTRSDARRPGTVATSVPGKIPDRRRSACAAPRRERDGCEFTSSPRPERRHPPPGSASRRSGTGRGAGRGTFGRGGAGFRSSSSSSSSSSRRFRRRLHFFGVARRRHDGDQRLVHLPPTTRTFGGSVMSLMCLE